MQAAVPASSMVHWRGRMDAEGVAWLTLDKANASANSLSRDVMEEFGMALADLERSPPRALIITSAKHGFIAGADIKEFVGVQSPDAAFQMIRAGQLLLDRLAALKCVTVAAINGFALGGGLEVALACRYRVVADDASITLGFPEVQLGVHPGLGGTVRAVQLAGPIAAMDLMLTGRSIRPKQALALGLVDRLDAPRSTGVGGAEDRPEPAAGAHPRLQTSASQFGAVAPDCRRADALASREARHTLPLPCSLRAH